MIKTTSLLILLSAVFLVSVFAHEEHDPWKCRHGHEEIPEPEIIEVDEDFNPEGNDHTGRTLQSYSNMRTYGYYGYAGNNAFGRYVQESLVPPILNYFSAAFKVKYPISSALKVSSSSVCGFETPSILRTGVYADYVYIISTDISSDYVASSSACSLASGSRRPLIGHTTISNTYMQATTDVLVHEKNMICIMHEVVHTLGFSQSLYNYWLTSTGRTLTGHVESAVLDGYNTIVINAEPLTSRLRSFFGCSTLKGAYMENTGSSGTAGCHFERRQFAYEGMTSGLIDQMQFSQFTLAILESTGWYVADYAYADKFSFGEGEGCGFLTGSCSSSTYADFCSGYGRTCVNTGMGGGYCSSDTRSDNCQFVHPNTAYSCDNPSATEYARLPSLQTYGRGTGSKCFQGSLNSYSAGSETTFCFKYSCSGSGTSTELTLDVGGKSVVCREKGYVSVSGYAGSITCPNPQEYCSTIGQKVCPRGCMGKGTCLNGICSCNNGWKGQDCALVA